MEFSSLQPTLILDLNALRQNYRFLCNIVKPAICAAVVKDNAYGLGASHIVKTLYDEGCRVFFVAYASEALIIRQLFSDVELFLFQGVADDNIELINQYRFIPVISTLQQLFFWIKKGSNKIAPAIQIETGLNRLGFTEKEIKQDGFQQLIKKIKINSIISHLACANKKDHPLNQKQLKTFKRLSTLIPNAPKSLAASSGAFLGSSYHFDIVRAGAALYGINATPSHKNKMRPVVYIRAPILQVKEIIATQSVGYGATYQTKKIKKIATLSIGYADGLPRSLANRGKVFFENAQKNRFEAPIIGAISMDMITVDVTDLPEALLHIGNSANILDATYTLDNLSKDANTISYEIISRLGRRFKIEYKNAN